MDRENPYSGRRELSGTGRPSCARVMEDTSQTCQRPTDNHWDRSAPVRADVARGGEHRCALAYVKTGIRPWPESASWWRTCVCPVVKLARQYCQGAGGHERHRPGGESRAFCAPSRGSIRAVESKFCTYAVWWIRAYMLKFTIDNWRLVKVGTTQVQRKLFFGLRKEQRRLEVSDGEATTRKAGGPAAGQGRHRGRRDAGPLLRGARPSLEAPLRSRAPDTKTVGDLLSDLVVTAARTIGSRPPSSTRFSAPS